MCQQYPSRRGKPKLFREEFSYVQHTFRKRDDRYLWRCDKARNYDCPAKMYTVLRGNLHYFMSYIDEHNCTNLSYSRRFQSNLSTTKISSMDDSYGNDQSTNYESSILENIDEFMDMDSSQVDVIEIDD